MGKSVEAATDPTQSDGAASEAEEIGDVRSLPSVSQLLAELGDATPQAVLVGAVRKALDDARRTVIAGGKVGRRAILDAARAAATDATSPWPRAVINATGVVLHTNLGRAVLSDDARAAMLEAAAYSDLEFDLGTGARGSRDSHTAELLTRIVGAEAAAVVNNNAGALALALAALARDRGVIVSRGQAVEIGGRLRIPDVMTQSGAVLREVGTTNRTYASDYADACNERTALLLRVHLSNFQMSGFVAQPSLEEMVEVAAAHGVAVLDDLGSGCLVDTETWGLRHEPTVQESVRSGADVVLFSGDKLLGGPQAGLIVGRSRYIQAIRRHPLARAFRCDKVTLAAMHATLLHYLCGEVEQIPTLRMLALPAAEIEARAAGWLRSLSLTGARLRPASSAVGGGSLPGSELSSTALVLRPEALNLTADSLAARLRAGRPPVVGRIEDGELWLDPRTVLPEQEEPLLHAVRAAAQADG
ncbi:MAG: L-seryl-tRNA(Sec) selenium transferase [Chloroflexia bacterium]